MPKGEPCRQCYRYRTRALVGVWRSTLGAALDDAIRAGQARVDPGGQVRWVVPGGVEIGATENRDRRREDDHLNI
jgi:hypothetical protein